MIAQTNMPILNILSFKKVSLKRECTSFKEKDATFSVILYVNSQSIQQYYISYY